MGRQREMAQLKAALDGALAGHGRLVMLAGEPGTGKTRIAQELASYAEEQSAQVLWGWCYEEEGAPPYWPWVQPIRSYVQHKDAEHFSAEMGPGAADIAEVVPEIRSKLPDLETPPALEPEQARFRLFDSITAFLKNAAQRQPLMLVLDDLHWADRSSLLLLEFLTKEVANTHILLVGTFRDTEVSRRHPLSQSLGALIRESTSGGFQRVQLGGFTQQEVSEFLAASTGVALTDDAAEIVHRRTEGNPLFVTEVARQLGPQNPAGDQTWVHTIPEGIRDAIGRRLNRLSEECNQALTTASIIGREFDFKLLTLVTSDIDESRLLEAMDEAVGAYLVEEAPGSIERYRFSHALIQETLSEELTTSRRVRLHARIGEALEELYRDDADAHSAELAHHFAEAEPILGPEKLVLYSRLAGEGALTTYAYEEALGHFQRALAAKQGQSVDAESAALLFGLGRAQIAMNNVRAAVESLNRASDYYVKVGDVDQSVALAECTDYSLGHGSQVVQLITRALELVPSDSHQAGRLLYRYGRYLGMEGGNDSASQSAFDQALAIARREDDETLEMRTLVDATGVDIYHLRWQEAIRKGSMVIQLAQRADDPRATVAAHYFMVSAFISMGNLGEAREHASAMLAPAQRLRDRYWLRGAWWKNGIVLRLAGEWEAARDYIHRALEIAATETSLFADKVLLENEVGDFNQGEAYLERFVEVGRANMAERSVNTGYLAMTIPLYAQINGMLDRLDIARDAAQIILSSPSVNPNAGSRARAGLALLAVLLGDVESAREQYAALESTRGTMLWWLISGDRLLGLLSQTMGNLDQAMDHFEDALAFCRKAGYRPELAWSCCDYAEVLLQRASADEGRGGSRTAPTKYDRARPISLLEEALAISSELGMRPLMERVTERLERARAKPARAPTYPDGLTQREVEVLSLIAGGKTNLEIADELVIAEGTARRHVANIYEKIGAANRAEATRYAMEKGLLSLDEARSAEGDVH